MECVRNHEVSGSVCEERRDSWKKGTVKRDGGQGKEKGECDEKGVHKPYILFLCTAHLYSTKHKVVVIRSSLFQLTTTLAQQSPFQPLSTRFNILQCTPKCLLPCDFSVFVF